MFGLRRGPSSILMLVAVVLFLLSAFGVDLGGFDRTDLIALGLAAFAAGHAF